MIFKIDLRKLQTHWAIWSSKPAHHRWRFEHAWSGNRRKQWQFKFLFDIEPQRYSGEIPIGSDIIHVSGRDRKDDLEDDDLAPPKPWSQHWVRLIYFNIRNLEKSRRIYQSNHHHFNTQQLIKEKTINSVADQKYKKWLTGLKNVVSNLI